MSRECCSKQIILPRDQVSQIFYIAMANAASVACLYLHQVDARDLNEAFLHSMPLLSLLPGSTFLGYASGVVVIAFFPRLSDHLTIPAHLGLLAGSLAVAGAAPSASILLVASFAIGSGASVAQRLLAAAGAIGGEKAGSVIGTVLAVALLAVLTVRIAGGFVADSFGWRAVFILAAGFVLSSCLLYARRSSPIPIPSHTSASQNRLLQLWITSPLLRKAAVQQAMAFATYGSAWMVLFLETDATERIPVVLGAGLAGAAASVLVGRLAHREAGPRSVICSAFGLLVATALPIPIALGWPPGVMRIVLLTVGMALLDAGLQTLLVVNQTRVQADFPSSRPQAAALLTTFGFTGTAIGSSLSHWSSKASIWYMASGVAATFAAFALICSLDFVSKGRGRVNQRLLPSEGGDVVEQLTPASISPRQAVSKAIRPNASARFRDAA